MKNHFKIKFKDLKVYAMKFKNCKVCGKLITACSMTKHLFQIHKKSRKSLNYCANCDFVFLFQKEFSAHTGRCNGVNGKKYPINSTRIRLAELDASCHVRNM